MDRVPFQIQSAENLPRLDTDMAVWDRISDESPTAALACVSLNAVGGVSLPYNTGGTTERTSVCAGVHHSIQTFRDRAAFFLGQAVEVVPVQCLEENIPSSRSHHPRLESASD